MKKTILLLSCLTLVLMQACGSKPEPEPTPSTPDPVLSVNPTSLSFNQDGGSRDCQVRTTENSIPQISYTRVAAEARLPSSNSEKSCLSAERI